MTDERLGLDRVVVINDDATASGGAAAIALASARLLKAHGVSVTFLCGDPAGGAELTAQGIDVAVLGGRHLLNGARLAAGARGLYDIGTVRALQRWIALHDTPRTIYHLHNWHKVLSPSVFQALRKIAPRLVMSTHDYFLTCPNGGYFDYVRQTPCDLQPGSVQCIGTNCDRRRYLHKLWRVARHNVREHLFDLARYDAVVLAVHDGLAAHLVQTGIPERSVRTLRNPVTPWRATRVPAEKNRNVFFIGRLDTEKGVDLLAEACRRAGSPLHLIGDGPSAAHLKEAYPEARLHGWLSRNDIAELVVDARMVVLPTRCRETFGLAAVEALTSGIPVIVSNFALIADEVVQQGFGLACNPYDVDTLAALIGHLANNDDKVEEMSRHTFAQAQTLAPTPEEWMHHLLRLYTERLLASPMGQTAPVVANATWRTRVRVPAAVDTRHHG